MHTGMLWFDGAPNVTLASRVQKATEYYRLRYHRAPNLCLVSPDLLSIDQPQIGKVTLRGSESVLPDHIWIGIEDRTEPAASRNRSPRPRPRRGSCYG